MWTADRSVTNRCDADPVWPCRSLRDTESRRLSQGGHEASSKGHHRFSIVVQNQTKWSSGMLLACGAVHTHLRFLVCNPSSISLIDEQALQSSIDRERLGGGVPFQR